MINVDEGDGGFIAGIYNFCDRWCERCAFTGRCRVFARQQQHAGTVLRDEENAAFWLDMAQILGEVEQLLQKIMADAGIPLPTPDESATFMAHEEKQWKLIRQHPLSQQAEAYAAQAEVWFVAAKPLFQQTEAILNQQIANDEIEPDPMETANLLTNAAGIIRWYQYQIGVKLMRALRSQYSAAATEWLDLSDQHGSAKVALLGIDRSLAAWELFRRALPDQDETIMPLLAGLDRLRRQAEQQFPQARAFIRPGLDTD